MSTRSVTFYEKKIQLKMADINSSPLFFHKENELRNTSFSLLQGIAFAIKNYFMDEDEFSTSFVPEQIANNSTEHHRRHRPLLEQISNTLHLYFMKKSSTPIIHLVISGLEKGVLEQKCNLKGNYANLCRAIINSSDGFEGWEFSEKFKQTLEIDKWSQSIRPL